MTCPRWSLRYQLPMSVLARLFSIGPIRKGIWQEGDPFPADRLRCGDTLFATIRLMTDPPENIALESEEELDRGGIRLYHHVAPQVELIGKCLQEVTCRHGGGAP